MGQNSKIEWCDHTFNPWWGCAKVSPGCAHCYAETFANRLGHHVWGNTATPRRMFGDAHWREPLKWNAEAQRAGQRRRVFCLSMGDVFEDRRDLDRPRDRLYGLVEATPWLDWLLLTKRIENADRLLPRRWSYAGYDIPPTRPPFPRNVWIGISAENQVEFDGRWPVLEWVGRMWCVPVLFISAEPLLGPIDMRVYLTEPIENDDDGTLEIRGIDWVITGGESGPKARPMHPDWARSIRDQCIEAEVPFLFKQWGEWMPCGPVEDDQGLAGGRAFDNARGDRTAFYGPMTSGRSRGYRVLSGEQVMVRAGKHNAGRLLDGREWNEFPEER